MASIINAATSGGLISTADTSGILQLQTASTTAVTVNASQNVGIGTASPASKLHIVSTTLPQLRVEFNSSYYTTLSNNGTLNVVDSGTSNKWVFQRNGTEQAIIDPSGNLGLGVTPSAWDTGIALKAFQFSATGCVYGYSFGGNNFTAISNNFYINSSGTGTYLTTNTASQYSQSAGQHRWFTAPSGTAGNAITFTQAMTLDASGNLGIGTTSPAYPLDVVGASSGGWTLNMRGRSSDNIGYMRFSSNNGATNYAAIGTPAANTLAFDVNGSERARIDSSGNLLVGKTASDVSVAGTQIESTGTVGIVRNAAVCLIVNRLTDDGTLVSLRQASTEEGTISVSGTTVSYNGGHLSRWAQMLTTPELFKGTVMSNLDEMNVYTKDGQPVANEQLNKVKVSDTEGDVNVAGVFVNWSHDEDHNVDEINMAMTGDMIIRIAQGVTVVRGDLLMSAGDGTAKPQGDDIVRSKTVAKVTSNHITCTYADGSYCVPCVLMAC
jgi:hypothetical protein